MQQVEPSKGFLNKENFCKDNFCMVLQFEKINLRKTMKFEQKGNEESFRC